MKIKNKIAGIISVICIGVSISTAYAVEHEVNYIKSLNGDYINIAGNAVNGGGSEVFLRIDYTENGFVSDTGALEENTVYQRQTTADENGDFTFKVKLKDIGESSYTLRLGVLGDDGDVSETFVFYGDNYRKQALGAIQTAQRNKDVDGLVNAITTYYGNLYLDTPVFDKYFAAEPDLGGIKSILTGYPLITTVSALEEALEGVVIVKDLKKAADFSGMEAVFGEYDSKLGINDLSIYKQTYSKLPDKIKEAVYKNFAARKYNTPADIKTAFTVSVLNTYLKNAIGAASVKQLLEDNKELLGIDMTRYDMADSKFLELIGTEFKSVADVKTKLEALKSSSNTSGGGGGGGKSSGSTNSATVLSTLGQSSVTKLLDGEDYPFEDMEEYYWAKEATLALYKRNVLQGIGNNRFAPERVITREEFLKLIINGFEITDPAGNDVSFSDVDKNEWYYPYIKTGVNSGIIKGMDNNRFGIGYKITRQDLVVMLYRAVNMKRGLPQYTGLSGFKDYETISDYAQNAVMFAETNYIVSGMGDGNFYPKNNATRAETAVILYRAIEYLANNM